MVGGAKRNLVTGEKLDGGGGYTVYGYLESAETAAERNYAPFEQLDVAEVVSPIEKDEIVGYEDVELDSDSFLYRLRERQDDN